MAKVSILMNCYNGEKYLKEAIDSVMGQTYTDFELVFIDNQSADSTGDIVRSYNDSRISYYVTPEHMTLCEARVYAKQLIGGDYFCVLDADDAWMPDKLEKQVNLMESDKEIGLIYSNTVFFTDAGDERLAYGKTMPSGYIFKLLLENYFVSLETIMVRIEYMQNFNLYFTPGYNVASDFEFIVKTAFYVKSVYIDEPLGRWRYGNESQTNKHLCSFPREHEKLFADMRTLVEGFDDKYQDAIRLFNANVDSMYGMCAWKNNNKAEARVRFLKAAKVKAKYMFAYIMTFFMSYDDFVDIKR